MAHCGYTDDIAKYYFTTVSTFLDGITVVIQRDQIIYYINMSFNTWVANTMYFSG